MFRHHSFTAKNLSSVPSIQSFHDGTHLLNDRRKSRASPRGSLGHSLLLPEVVPEIDANSVSFYGEGGQSCLDRDSPVASVR